MLDRDGRAVLLVHDLDAARHVDGLDQLALLLAHAAVDERCRAWRPHPARREVRQQVRHDERQQDGHGRLAQRGTGCGLPNLRNLPNLQPAQPATCATCSVMAAQFFSYLT